ncbi:hypothetical protein Tco_0671755 [Tanacetum coccineum]
MSFDLFLPFFVEVKKDDRRIVERKKSTLPKLPLDVCSLSFGEPRDRSYEIIATKQEKIKGGFEYDIDDEGEEDKEDEEGDGEL